MATYLDIESLAPTAELAEARCRSLKLSGSLLPSLWRHELLLQAGEGDSVVCGVAALPFWRKLQPSVRLVSVQALGDADSLANRFDTWEEWAMVQCRLTPTEAKHYVTIPPKSEKHKHFQVYHHALSLAGVMQWDHKRRPSLPEFEDVVAHTNEEVSACPYQWTLVDNIKAVAEAREAFGWGTSSEPVICGLDCETDVVLDHPNEMHDRLVGVGLAFGSECYYGSIEYEPWRELLTYWLPRTRYMAHNSKYDRTVLRRAGIHLPHPTGDSLLAAYLLGVPEAGLKVLVKQRYGVSMTTYAEVVGEGKQRKSISEIDPNVVAPYCCGDAYWAQRLLPDLLAELDGGRRTLYDYDLRLVEVIGEMQARGIDFDMVEAAATLGELEGQNFGLAKVIDQIAAQTGYERPPRIMTCSTCRNGKKKRLTCEECKGIGQWAERVSINPGSPIQIADWLHRHLKLPIQRVSETTRQPSVDALSLLRLREHHAAPYLLLKWKQNEKYIGYLRSWLKWSQADSKLHSVLTLSRTRSGRLSSEDPNLQQVKLDWRNHFVAPDGGALITADYGQIEVRIPAKMSGDPGLVAAMTADPATLEGNIHVQNTMRLFGVSEDEARSNVALKTRAKNYLFGALYGSEGKEVQEVLEKQLLQDDSLDVRIPTVAEIHGGIMQLYDIYPVYFHEWVPAAIEKCREMGGWAYTLYGRPRCLPDILSSDKYLRKHAERQCISHIIQGTAADIMRFAILEVDEYCTRMANMLWLILTVHDELVVGCALLEAYDYVEGIARVMELSQPLDPIPLRVDVNVGRTWASCHK